MADFPTMCQPFDEPTFSFGFGGSDKLGPVGYLRLWSLVISWVYDFFLIVSTLRSFTRTLKKFKDWTSKFQSNAITVKKTV